MRHLALLTAAVLFLASAQAMGGAKQHFMAGQDYYTQGRYDKAVEEFEEAYRLDPRPLLLFNLAQTWEKLGDLEKAIDYLKRFIEADPENEEKATLLAKVANLEARVAATGITVKCSEAEAAILVDGTEVGRTPQGGIISVKPGPHKITITKAGFRDFVMSVAISSGVAVEVDAVLEPGAASAPAAAAAGPEEKGEGASETEVDEGGSKVTKVLPWVMVGVGGAAAVVGWGVIGGMALSSEDHGKAIIADAVGIGGAVVGAAGLAWGLYNILSSGSESEEASASALLVPAVGPDGAGVAAIVAF